jgi:hypothetical protein
VERAVRDGRWNAGVRRWLAAGLVAALVWMLPHAGAGPSDAGEIWVDEAGEWHGGDPPRDHPLTHPPRAPVEWVGDVVGGASTPRGRGYWLVHADGRVDAVGDATWHGDARGLELAGPIVAMAATPTGDGYWLAAHDGGVFAYGDAAYRGSAAGLPLAAPIAGIAPTPSGRGYWLAAHDGGVFAYGDAVYRGSVPSLLPPGTRLDGPVIDIAPTPSGRGYLLLGVDGGVFAFGDARFHGSALGPLGAAAVAIDSRSGGYWVVMSSGEARVHGTAKPLPNGPPVSRRITDAISHPLASGVRLVYEDGTTRALRIGPGPDQDGATATAADAGYAVAATLHGRDVRWDPCTPIRYKVNTAGQPAAARSIVVEAIAQIAAVTGLEFVDMGDTADRPNAASPRRPPSPDYDLLVAYAPGAAFRAFTGTNRYMAVGGPAATYQRGSGWRYDQAIVLIDLSDGLPFDWSSHGWGRVVLHELGHVAGLLHTEDPAQLMYGRATPRTSLADGDLTGLRRLGANQGCLLPGY